VLWATRTREVQADGDRGRNRALRNQNTRGGKGRSRVMGNQNTRGGKGRSRALGNQNTRGGKGRSRVMGNQNTRGGRDEAVLWETRTREVAVKKKEMTSCLDRRPCLHKQPSTCTPQLELLLTSTTTHCAPVSRSTVSSFFTQHCSGCPEQCLSPSFFFHDYLLCSG
jgi:hypothetical protein